MSLSLTALRAAFAQNTNEVFLTCLQIDHADLADPLLFVNDNIDLDRGGETYLAFPFRIQLPDDTDEEVPRPQLVIDNVSRELIDEIRTLSSTPTITVDVVLASSPTTVEYGPFVFIIRKADYDALTIFCEMGYEVDLLDLPANRWLITPATVPGSF